MIKTEAELQAAMADLEIGEFIPGDAPGVVALYREVYGDHYPVATVYDPQELIRQMNGEAYRVVARLAGEVVGHISLYRSSPPNPRLYEHGQMLVSHQCRQLNIAQPMAMYSLQEIPGRYHMDAIWGEAVCNHLFTQVNAVKGGFAETGLEVDLMPASSYGQAFSGSDTGNRVSAVLIFKNYRQRPQTLYLPDVYEDLLRQIYGQWECGHDFQPAAAALPLDQPTRAKIDIFTGAQVARLTFDVIGGDFAARLEQLEEQAVAAGVNVFQVFFRLTHPWTSATVAVLRARGYFFGGCLPLWFEDDGLLMQKITPAPDFDSMHLYSKRAKELRRRIAEDWRSVQNNVGGDV